MRHGSLLVLHCILLLNIGSICANDFNTESYLNDAVQYLLNDISSDSTMALTRTPNSMRTGYIIKESSTGAGATQLSPLNYAAQTLSYTAGGITFTYPAGFFSAPPTVLISLTLTGLSYTTATTVVAMIASNSASSTTVRVNKATLASILEAGTNDVEISIFAVAV